jgi:hypothetical protein
MTKDDLVDKWVKSGLLDGFSDKKEPSEKDPVAEHILNNARRGGMINNEDIDYIFPVVDKDQADD